MSKSRPGSRLSSFAYNQIRYDLRPQTKVQLVQRFLAEITSFQSTTLKAAKRNIEKDAGEALLSATNVEDIPLFVRNISSAQRTLTDQLDPNDAALWWPNIVHSIRESPEALKTLLVAELRDHLQDPNPLIKISALFSLALLGIPDLAPVIDNAVRAHEHWFANEELYKWLVKLISKQISLGVLRHQEHSLLIPCRTRRCQT
jgi:hypothetical protein